ncbi:MAG: oligoendopeptidase F [Chloroflexi bacterium]|nr:MAG: oligoendopeptidase F [Chloroflexota bacterium]
MIARTLPARSEVAKEHTWDPESVFASEAEWEAEFDRVAATIPDLQEFKGHLGSGPDAVADYFEAAERALRSLGRIQVYATMFTAVDSSDQAASARSERVRNLTTRVNAALSFAEPEMLQIGIAQLRSWARDHDRLRIYDHHFDRLGRRQAHVRSEEVEEVLSLAAEPLQAASTVHGILANAELIFEPANGAAGDYELAQGTYADLLTHPDRDVRRSAWENYGDAHLALRRTMAASLNTGIRRDVFFARARHYRDSLEAALDPNNIPVEVFHNVLAAFQANLGTWHRYWRLRKRVLDVDHLYVFDTRAPLGRARTPVPYSQAVDWISEGLQPMGSEYVTALRQGALEQRWVDIYPNRGKRMGAFSMGVPGTHPFIFMSYNDNVFSMSTLAHELGHSMHSWYSKNRQPYVYANYGLFIAEVASNFHQAMVRAHLLQTNRDPDFQVNLIEEAMANFHRYFFIMPSLARFELELHQRVERGEAVTADAMTDLMASLLDEVYGGVVEHRSDLDRQRSGITWAQFHTHLYSNFYVYQYATGIAGAHALAERVLDGKGDAVRAYIDFLSAGSSDYPLDVLRSAGVDMNSPEPVNKAFAVMAGYVDRLEQLLGEANSG